MKEHNVFQCHILGHDETLAAIRARIKSKAWWVIPHINSVVPQIALRMVEECYPTGNGFHAYVLALPGVPIVYLAHKSQMSKSRVAHILGIDVPDHDGRDILMCFPPDVLEQMTTLTATTTFTNWIDA